MTHGVTLQALHHDYLGKVLPHQNEKLSQFYKGFTLINRTLYLIKKLSQQRQESP